MGSRATTLRVRRSGWWRRFRAPVLLAALAAGATNLAVAAGNVGVGGLGWVGHLELAALQTRLSREPAQPDPRIVLVTIERETPTRLGMQRPVGPVPRDYHAALLAFLREAGTRLVVFDLLFTDSGLPEEDEALRDALAASAPTRVVLAVEPEPVPGAAPPNVYRFRRPVVLPPPPDNHVSLGSPVAFDPGGTLRGAVLLQIDAATGEPVSHLGLAAAVGFSQATPGMPHWHPARHVVAAGDRSWPVGEDGECLTRWTDRANAFKRLEYAEALALLSDPEARGFFRGALVIVGDASGADVHRTPLGRVPGVEFVANTVNTLLDPTYSGVWRWPIPANAAWSWLLGMLAATPIAFGRPRAVVFGLFLTFGAAWLVPMLLFRWGGVWVDLVGPVSTVALTAAAAGLLWGMRDRSLAQRFAPRHVREGRPEALTEDATVLFVDLRGSTQLADEIGARRAQEALSRLLEVPFGSAAAVGDGRRVRVIP
jgi:CHASE2 domain-containing sensor protein